MKAAVSHPLLPEGGRAWDAGSPSTSKRSEGKTLKKLLVCIALFPTIAWGQDMDFDPAPAEACLGAAPADPATCVGRAAEACMTANPQGETTMGMGFCLSREWEWWEGRLEAAYAALLARHEAGDAEMTEIGATVPSVALALTEMHHAWIAFRDAACDYERAQWAGGTGGGPATAACLMRHTGVMALELEGRIEMLGAQ